MSLFFFRDGGSQVILFILVRFFVIYEYTSMLTLSLKSFAVFGASGRDVPFPNWWGNPAALSVDRCKVRKFPVGITFVRIADGVGARQLTHEGAVTVGQQL
jgi:hypothetical protein